jgi:hypothetical protein
MTMRSAAAAIAWEFRQRHRWGFGALAAYFLFLAASNVRAQHIDFDTAQAFALAVVVPLAATFIYFLAVFTYGLAGDIGARQSIYPRRMFALPVPTAALVGWPMLYGSAAMVMLWGLTRLLAAWPAGVHVPVIWPALLAASLLAWTQALTWMPYPLPGLRVIVTVLWLTIIDAVIMIALEFKAREAVMLALLAPHVPLAYLVARSAVARARRGDVPDWRFAGDSVSRRRAPFVSAARAQTWFEWRQYGRSLPALVAILLPFEVAFLFVFRQTPVIVGEAIFVVLTTPPLMAAFVAATVRDSSALTPFTATRPLTGASLIAAKLKATIWSTVAAWLLVVISLPIALKLTGTSTMVMEHVHELVEIVGMPRAVALMLLGFIALVASTWKQLVQSLYVGMSGREWAVKASVFVALSVIALIVPFAHWAFTSKHGTALLWDAFPSIVGALVVMKTAAAAWIAVRLHRRGVLSDRTLVVGALTYDVLVFALYALLIWIFPNLVVRHYLLALLAILAVPLARLSAAPLALDWNRHR